MSDEDPSTQSRLVDEICSISKRSISCHLHNRKIRFINWYHVLGVEETTGFHVIKKRYHNLALQLHPDKNKLPKAEVAFKILAQAYVCLSDATKRRAFDAEMLHNFCYECSKTPSSPKKPPNSSKRSSKSQMTISSSVQNLRERYKEEAKVIENCLKANSLINKKELQPFDIPKNNDTSWSRLSCRRKELPLFDPAHYAFHGYPHIRTRVNFNDEFRSSGGGGGKYRSRGNFPLFGGAIENN